MVYFSQQFHYTNAPNLSSMTRTFLRSLFTALLLAPVLLHAACTYSFNTVSETITLPGNATVLNTLSVCTQYQFVYRLTNTSGSAVSDQLTFNFPEGISYSSLVSSSGATSVTYVSGSTSPVLNVNNWNAGATLTITLIAQTPSCTPVTTGTNYTTISGANSCGTYSISSSIGMVVPVMYVTNTAASGSLLLNTGDVQEFVFMVKNNSGDGATLPQINVACTPDPTINYLGNYYISTSAASPAGTNMYTYIYPTAVAGSVTAYQPIPTGGNITIGSGEFSSFYGMPVMPQGAYLYVHIPFKVTTCGASGGSYDFSWGCSSTACSTSHLVTNINVVHGNPLLQVYDNPGTSNGTFCTSASTPTTAVMSYSYKNNGTVISGAPAGNAKAINLKIFLDAEVNFGTPNTSTMTLSNGAYSFVVPPGIISSTTYVFGHTYTVYTIDFSALSIAAAGSWQPLGPGSIADIDGDGFVDDIAEGSTFKLTVNYTYNTASCPIVTHCGFGSADILGIETNYNDQCLGMDPGDVRQIGFNPYYVNEAYAYSAAGDAATLTLPPDVVEGIPFTMTMCTAPSYQRWGPANFDFACPNGYHQMKINLPAGYHFDATGYTIIGAGTPAVSTNLYQMPSIVATARCGGYTQTLNPTVQEFCQQGSTPGYILIRFGRINFADCGGINETYELPCVSLPMYLDCVGQSATTCPSIPQNFGVDNVNYSLDYVCDPGCTSCASTIVCASGGSYHHCNGECSSYFKTENDFTFLRTTLGDDNPVDYYDCTAAHPVMPLTTSTAPTIDLSSAYPADLVEAKVTGSFKGTLPGVTLTHMGASYSQMYLQIRYDQLPASDAATPDIFTLDTAAGHLLITGPSGSLNVPSSDITTSYTVVAGVVLMNFNLPAYARAYISTDTDIYSFDADLFLRVKSNPWLGTMFHNFFSWGYHPLIDLRTEFMGTKPDTTVDNSCDSWGTHFTIEQARSYVDFYSGRFGEQGMPVATCDQYNMSFVLETQTAKYGIVQDDFKNEYRPTAALDPDVTLHIPPGYNYLGSHFRVISNNYSAGGPNHFSATGYATLQDYVIPPSVIGVSTTPAGTTLVYHGINGPGSCWPGLDNKFSSLYPIAYIQVDLQPTCDALPVDTTEFIGSYRVNVNQSDPAYQVPTAFDIKRPVYHQVPTLTVNPPAAAINVYSNQAVFDFTYCNTSSYDAHEGWLAIENSTHNSLNLSSSATTVKLMPAGTVLPATNYTDALGHTALLVNVGSITHSGCVQLELMAEVDSSGCVPTGNPPFPDHLTIKYGNQCSGVPATSVTASCLQGSVTFPFLLYPSSIQLVPNGGFPTAAVDLCNGVLHYHFTISSHDVGTVRNPTFWVNLPTGITVQNAVFTYPISGPGTTTPPLSPDGFTFGASGTDAGWNLSSHFPVIATNGLTGSTTSPNNQIDVVLTLQTSCAYNTTDYITFYAGGISSCSQPIVSPTPPQHRPSINNATPADDLSINFSLSFSDGAPTLNCSNTATYTVTVTNTGTAANTHNDVLSVTLPSGVPLAASNAGTGIISGGTVTWNIPAGSLGAGGTQSFTFDVNTNGTLCIKNMQVKGSIGFNENVSCTASGGSCNVVYNSDPVITLLTACCECQTVTASATDASCGSSADGTATANVSGGYPPFTYSWNTTPVQTTATATGLVPGSYTVTVSGSYSCVSTATVTVGSGSGAIPATISPAGPISACGSVLLSANTGTGFTYQWQLNGSNITGATGATYNANASGNYTVIVYHDGCSGTSDPVAVTILPQDNAAFSYSASAYCKTAANPVPTVTGTTGGTFSAAPAGLVFASTSTGEINLTASTAGTYTVTYTTPGPCSASSTFTVTITPQGNGSFSYGASAYCKTAANPTPVISGAPGGTFSASPAGLVFVSTSSGQINLSSSAAGTYTVTYTTPGTCPGTGTFTVTITAPPVATFHYLQTTYCKTAANPSPVFTGGGVAGIFTASPTGLVFVNTSTGQVDLTASAAGTYTVTNTIPASGGCGKAGAVTTIRIVNAPVATFHYSQPAYCKTTTANPSPVYAAGGTAGTFSATPAGLVFVSTSTGQVSIAASAPGTYTVTNTIAAGPPCGTVSASTTITITAAPISIFVYSATSYCQTGANPSPTFLFGGTAGVFSTTPTGLVFVSTATGEINLASSAAGTYTVTNTIAASGGCAAVHSSRSVTIVKPPVATFSYALTAYCKTMTNPSPVYSGGGTAGTFTATPAGLMINPATGTINLGASAAGTYTITNTVAGTPPCGSATASTVITITPPPIATFHYSSTAYCQSAANPAPIFATGGTAGLFNASPTGLVFVSTSTGLVNLASSTPGTYTVTNSIAPSGGCKGVVASTTITITAPQVATFAYPLTAYCKTGTNPSPVFSGGGVAGTFSATPAGLVINATTGTINLATSAANTYTVTNTIPASGGCPAVTASTTVTITAPPSAIFAYPLTTYCTSSADPTPVIAPGSTAGTFIASPAGLVFVSTTTGQIDVSATVPGTYTITNNIPASGGCGPVRYVSTVTIINCGCDYGTQLPATISGVYNNAAYSANNSSTVISGSVIMTNVSMQVGSGVTITVPSGASLMLTHCHLWACQDMWTGIVVQPGGKLVINRNSLIEDAITAVYVPSTTWTAPADYALTVSATIFNKNYTAVKIDNYAQSAGTYPYSLTDAVFTNRNLPFITVPPFTGVVWPAPSNLKVLQNAGTLQEHYINGTTFPANGWLSKAPYIGQPSFYGVYLDMVGNSTGSASSPTYYEILLGSNTGTASQLNLYDNVVYGIYSQNSNVTVDNSAFQYMAVGGLHGTTGGTAIYGIVTKQDIYRRMRVQPVTPLAYGALPPNPNTTPFTNTFYDVRRAVDVHNYFETVINGADVRSTQVVNTPGVLTLNPVGGYGFYIKTNRYNAINVTANVLTNIAEGITFTADATPYMSYAQAQYVGPVTIDYNIVQAHYPGNTVTTQFVNDAISVTDVISSYGTTVGVLGSTGTVISTQNNRLLNVFRGIYSANWQRQFSHSQSNYITMRQEANNFAGNPTTQYGISHVNSLGNTIIDNNINGTSRLKDVWKGIYSSMNGKEIVSCNYVNNLGRGIEFEAQHMGVTFQDNIFNLNAKGYMLSNNGVIGAQVGGGVSPASDNRWPIAANWMGTNYQTYTLNSLAGTSPLNVRAGATYDPTNNSGSPVTGAYSTSTLPVVAASGFRTCPALPSYGCTFCVVQQLETVVHGAVYRIWPDQSNQINANRAYRMLKIDPSLMTGSSTLTGFYNATLGTNTDQLSVIEDDLKLNNFADAGAGVASFVPVNPIEANYAKVYSLYIKNQTDTIVAGDSTDLYTLANGCPDVDGVAVYQARALYNSVYNQYRAFEDNCPSQSPRSLAEEPTVAVVNCLVYPNPSKGELFVSLSDTDLKEAMLEVTDITGKRMLLQPIVLENGTGKLNLDLDNGVYLVNITVPGLDKAYVRKIVISK